MLLKIIPKTESPASTQLVNEGDSPLKSDIAHTVVQSFQIPTINKKDPVALSPREWEVLALLARGFTYLEIAELLQIRVVTVNSYIRRVYRKLRVRSRAKAVAVYMQSFAVTNRGKMRRAIMHSDDHDRCTLCRRRSRH